MPGRRRLFLVAALTGVVFLCIGIAGRTSDGFRVVWLAAWPEKAAILQVVETAQTIQPVQDDGACRFNVEQIDAALADRILACHDQHGPGIAVLGDSHAIDLFGIISANPERPFVIGLTKPSCRPTTVDRDCPYASFDAFVTANPKVFQVTLFEMSGAYLLTASDGRPGVQTVIERQPLDARVAEVPLHLDAISQANAALVALARKVPLIWVGPRIEPQVQLEWLVNRGCTEGLAIRPGTEANYQRLDVQLTDTASVPYLNQNTLFGLEFPRDLGGCDGLFWRDGDHYSAYGIANLAGRADIVAAAMTLLPAER